MPRGLEHRAAGAPSPARTTRPGLAEAEHVGGSDNTAVGDRHALRLAAAGRAQARAERRAHRPRRRRSGLAAAAPRVPSRAPTPDRRTGNVASTYSSRSSASPGSGSTSAYSYVSLPKMRRSERNKSSGPAARRSSAGARGCGARGLQHPRQAEVMVGVVVGQEDLTQLHHVRAEQLPLRALAQSKSIRSPPRRSRTAVGARNAVGIDPDVPRNTRSRSTRRESTSGRAVSRPTTPGTRRRCLCPLASEPLAGR